MFIRTDENIRGPAREPRITMTDDTGHDNDDASYLENDVRESDSGTGGIDKDGFSLSRRAIIASLGAAGLLAGASGNAAAASGDHIGESWSGQPGTGVGLSVNLKEGGQGLRGIAGSNTDNKNDIGVKGETYSTKGIGLVGVAPASSGQAIGLKGRVDSPDAQGLKGQVFTTDPGNGDAIYGESYSESGTAIRGRSRSSGTTYGVVGEVDSSNGFGLYTPDDAKIDGNLQVQGTKNFVQTVDTASGPKDVHYTAVEAGDPMTEHTGNGEMEDGHALIELPTHFDMVTSDDQPVAVQVTPYAEEKVHPQVVEKSPRYISVEDFGDGPDDYEFSYTVKGVREGFEDQEIVRDT